MPGRSFEPGSLLRLAHERARTSLASGALQPITTETVEIDEDAVRFSVYILGELQRKLDADADQRSHRINPFLDPDPELVVTDVSETHLCLLNKFNILDDHLLIVTRAFELQSERLDETDFTALALCMAEFDGLGFFNSGPVAGASQPHRHVQLVPVPIGAGPEPVPLAARIASGALPFEHAFSAVDGRDASAAFGVYCRHLEDLGLVAGAGPPEPYNFLVTREWMLTVPRRRERVDGIPINALAFAGALLVRDREQLESLRRGGAFPLLTRAAGRLDGRGQARSR
jgi:ATP adenylyltransferase